MKFTVKYFLTIAGLLSLLSALPLEARVQAAPELPWNIWDDFETSTPQIVEKGIYGDDNRRLVTALDESESSLKEMSRSVLAQVPLWRVTSEDSTSYSINTKSLAAGMNFCADEKFSELPLVSSCSAFLIASDLLLTAGHCIKDKFDCQKNVWVLDYEDSLGFSEKNPDVKIQKDNVVKCDKLISIQENSKLDYALIKLDRKITDRKPLSIRKFGKVSTDANLEVIGHPMGLPKIIANEARIRNNSLPFSFVTTADTFSGNSGSPVINSESHQVEGILVRGDSDFQMDIDLGCNRASHCLETECKGETAIRTTELPFKFFPHF
jgi:hypothetical protein